MSIYTFLKDTAADDTGFAGDTCAPLPDQRDLVLRAGESWVPGAYEGIILRSTQRIKRSAAFNFFFAQTIRRQIHAPTEARRAKIERTICENSAIAMIDPLLSFLHKSGPERSAVRDTALLLVKESEKRELVKVGIALLGQYGETEDKALLRLLGSHEEFAMYAAVAVRNLLPQNEANAFLLELAGRLHGWGKIAVIYELNYSLQESRDWVLRRGCKNDIALSYLANVCAIKGKMADALTAVQASEALPDEELLRGICDIFSGLLEEHPTNDGISDYPDAYRASAAFCGIAAAHPELTEQDCRIPRILKALEKHGLNRELPAAQQR